MRPRRITMYGFIAQTSNLSHNLTSAPGLVTIADYDNRAVTIGSDNDIDGEDWRAIDNESNDLSFSSNSSTSSRSRRFTNSADDSGVTLSPVIIF